MLRHAIITAIMACLSGCGGPPLSKNQRAEVENIAEDFADGSASNSDAASLKVRIEKLERQAKLSDEAHDLHFKNIGELSKNGVEDAENISKLSQSMIEHERLYHGR